MDSTSRSIGRIEQTLLDDAAPMNPKHDGVTIFIPAWNHRAYIPRALGSAIEAVSTLRDAGFDAEVLVIDDASRDGTQPMLRSLSMLYPKTPLRMVFLRQNRGLPRLRTAALRLARFRYVCMLDADNELLAENAPLFVRALVECQAAMAYGNLFDRRGRKVTDLRSNEAPTLRLTEMNYIDAFSFVDADKLLRLGGYTTNPDLYGWEDWEMILHLIAEEQTIVFVPAVLGFYSISPLSMIRETNRLHQERVGVIRRMYSQTGTREWDDLRVGRIYHPDVGYLDQW